MFCLRLLKKQLKNRLLLAQAFDLEGQFVGELTVIDNIPASKSSNSGSFMIEQSNDKKKFLVIQNPKYEKNSEEEFIFKVYDKDLKNLSNSSIELPYKDKKTSVINYYLSNTGDVYMLLNISLEKDERKKGEDKRLYSILTVKSSSDNSIIEYKVQLPQKQVSSIDLQINDIDKSIACAGFYSELGSIRKDVDGVFYLNIDMKTNKIITQSYHKFDRDLVLRLSRKKEGKKIKESVGISNSYSIQDFVKLPDGSAYVIAEDNYTVQTTRCNQNGVCVTTTTYYSLNILAIKISKTGEIQSITDIPKYQVARSSTYQSYLLMQKANDVYIVYNDNPKNNTTNISKFSDLRTFGYEMNGALTMVKLLPDGKYSKMELFSNKTKKLATQVRFGFKIDEGSYIAPLKQKKSFSFLRFDIK